MPGRPDVPVPPEPMGILVGGRPLKRWCWVGAFSEEVMLCAGVFQLLGRGPRMTWSAVWDRSTRTLAESTRRRRHRASVTAERLLVADGPVQIDLSLERGEPVETISPHGASYIWTRKSPARARGTVTLADRRFELDAAALVDESAGYHARTTDWRWSAGVGTTGSGQAVVWNVVTGLHDDPEASERTVWVDGVPHQLPALAFADDLSSVGDLAFTSEATRAHRENLLLVVSDYEQPFGRCAGSLPVAGEVTGLGVMERHHARW